MSESCLGTIIKPGTRYEIHSTDGRYVQAEGVMDPVKLVKMPLLATAWLAVEVNGALTLRSPGGWYATGKDGSAEGPLIQDPNSATHWQANVVAGQHVTLNTVASPNLHWTVRPGSNEIWLHASSAGSEDQAWRFIEVHNSEG